MPLLASEHIFVLLSFLGVLALLVLLRILVYEHRNRKGERDMRTPEGAALVLSWTTYPLASSSHTTTTYSGPEWAYLRGPRRMLLEDMQAYDRAQQSCAEIYGTDSRVVRIYRIAPRDYHAVCGPTDLPDNVVSLASYRSNI